MGTVGPAEILIWPYSTLYLLPKPTVAPEFHSFKYGDTHCLLRYSTDAGFTKTMARIHATTLGTARANPLRPVWSHSSWCSALLLSQTLFVGRPPLSVPCPDKRGQKQRLRLIRAHSLTQARGEEGNGRHNWEMLVVPVVAEACRKLLQPEANCILPGELAPGHRSLGSAKLHKSPGRCGQ